MASTLEFAGKTFRISIQDDDKYLTIKAFVTPTNKNFLLSSPFTKQTSYESILLATITATFQSTDTVRSRGDHGGCHILSLFPSRHLDSPLLTFYIFTLLLSSIEKFCSQRKVSLLWIILRRDSRVEHVLRLLGFMPCSCLEGLECGDVGGERVQLCKTLNACKASVAEELLVDVGDTPLLGFGEPSLPELDEPSLLDIGEPPLHGRGKTSLRDLEEPSLLDLEEPSLMCLGKDATKVVEQPLPDGHRMLEPKQAGGNPRLRTKSLCTDLSRFRTHPNDPSLPIRHSKFTDAAPLTSPINEMSPSRNNSLPLSLWRPHHQATTNSILTTTHLTDLLSLPTPLSHSEFPSLLPPKKTHCIHYFRTGTCAYAIQGCRFSHVLPSRQMLLALGFSSIPKWYQDRETERNLTKLEEIRLAATNGNDVGNGGYEGSREKIFQEPTSASANTGDILFASDTVTPSKQINFGHTQDYTPSFKGNRILPCIHWIRTGQCDFTFQPGGCRYLHVMPDAKTLCVLGIPRVPDWWLREQGSITTSSLFFGNTKRNDDDVFASNGHRKNYGTTVITPIPEPAQTKPITPIPSPPSSPTPTSYEKTHCSYYFRTGRCNFSMQGQKCKFSHELPSKDWTKTKEKEKAVVRLPPMTAKLSPVPSTSSSKPSIRDNIERYSTRTEGSKTGSEEALIFNFANASLRPTTPPMTTSTTSSIPNTSTPTSTLTFTPPSISTSKYRTPTPSLLPSIPTYTHPSRERKKYCTHFFATGECDFVQQGCKYLHYVPDGDARGGV